MIPDTQHSLLLRLRDPEDDEAWSSFTSLYSRMLHGFFRNRGLDQDGAREVTQDVLCSVLRSIDSLDYDPKRGRFRDWLFLVARRRLADHFRKRKRDRLQLLGDDGQKMLSELEDPDQDLERAWDLEHEQALFHWAAELVQPQVKPATWQAFWGLAVEQKTVEEVAEETGLSTASVYMAKSRVMARFKTLFDEASIIWEKGPPM